MTEEIDWDVYLESKQDGQRSEQGKGDVNVPLFTRPGQTRLMQRRDVHERHQEED
ncbi:MAG: hypothetical protein QGI09_08345 [Dehalococcoidia bacterium]|nr:hypothetical protein [Dehalococcoidia bacterium]